MSCMGESLYSIYSCISKLVVIHHIFSTQVSATGPLVLWFPFNKKHNTDISLFPVRGTFLVSQSTSSRRKFIFLLFIHPLTKTHNIDIPFSVRVTFNMRETQTSVSIGIINFERLSPNFIADTMNWFLNSVLD